MNNVLNSTDATRETLWTILDNKKYTICIPRIQRDYAQGRKEPEPTQIRQAFLKDVFYALTNDSQMDVNFIYGNTDEYKGVERFIPIDGQQRLTTLFLLHWYFAMWSGKMTDESKTVLNRFQYETRFTTGDFCKRLINDIQIDLKSLVEKEIDLRKNKEMKEEEIPQYLKAQIMDYYWFFSAYENDATIRPMIVMLQEIHNTIVALDDIVVVDSFFDKLIADNCPINFLFLNISDVGLTDDIYIKMNARGKALTRFENFKAQLTAYLSKTDGDFSREFIGNINGIWSQFFWNEEYRPDITIKNEKNKYTKSIVFDDQIMNLFRFVMMNEYICNVKIDDSSTETKYLVRRILMDLAKESDFQFVNHLFADDFRTVSHYKTANANVDERVFKFINTLLNVLAKKKLEDGNICFADALIFDKSFIDEEVYFKRLIRSVNEKTLNYEEQILLYSEFCFLVENSNKDGSFDKVTELTEFLRFISNLSKNMLYNGYDDYFRSIIRVREIVLSGAALDINTYAATMVRKNYKQGSGYGFVENQMIEECIKANLILRGDSWRTQIINAENSFLGSQITAILMFSGIWGMYEEEMEKWEESNNLPKMPASNCILNDSVNKPEYIADFELYLRKFNMVFDRDSLKLEMEKESLFRRALLTYGGADSYMLPAGKPISCFLDATDRDTSFRRLFRGDNTKKIKYFKNLLDSLDIEKDLVEQLQGIINSATYDDLSRWKKYFIEMPEILDSMYQNKDKVDPSNRFVFLNSKRFICRRSVDQILLLEKTQTNSTNREYYSYVLYLKSMKDGLNVSYFTTFSESAEKFMTYINNQDKEIQVAYGNVGTEDAPDYKYVARDNGMILYKSNLDNMLDYVKQTIK